MCPREALTIRIGDFLLNAGLRTEFKDRDVTLRLILFKYKNDFKHFFFNGSY